MTNAFSADLHSHTIASGHAFSTLDDMARAAAEAGITVLGVTEHGPAMDGAPHAGFFDMAGRLPPILHGVRVLPGIEANILDRTGRLDLTGDLLEFPQLVLAGLHGRTPYPSNATLVDNTDAVVRAAQNPAVHVIAHPYRSAFPVDGKILAEAAASTGTLIEVNLWVFRSLLEKAPDASADPVVSQTRLLLERLQECGGRYVLSSDAHHASELHTTRALVSAVCRLLDIREDNAASRNLAELAAAIPALRPGRADTRLQSWPLAAGREEPSDGPTDHRLWRGVFIEESLENLSLLAAVNVVGASSGSLEEEGDRGEVTFRRVEVPEEAVDAVVAEAVQTIKEGWYLHLVRNDHMKVVFRGKVFSLQRGDSDALQAAVDYGVQRQGIKEAQLGLARLFADPFG
ncbi:PHP domain-containing protein [Frankia gtarii]|uniref:PHP domain-containing protein n=1 Tax=Frankia gtarii TaxID=2950102 RepID=UPI0021BE2FC3|nr:PHP domain-containing protein [Frankia gtarii]